MERLSASRVGWTACLCYDLSRLTFVMTVCCEAHNILIRFPITTSLYISRILEAKSYHCFVLLMQRMGHNFPHGENMDKHFVNMRSLIQVRTWFDLHRSSSYKWIDSISSKFADCREKPSGYRVHIREKKGEI